MKKLTFYVLLALILFNSLVWIAVSQTWGQDFKLVACDVGQGDAILAIYGSVQVLVDAGPGRKVLDCLGKYLPFWDRKIEAVVLTHPEKDHFGGLIEVVSRYDVDTLLTNPMENSSQDYQVLKNMVGTRGIRVIESNPDMDIRLGMIYIDILFPTQQYIEENSESVKSTNKFILGKKITKKNLNQFSLVTLLSYKDFDALLTGDITPPVTDRVTEIVKTQIDKPIELLKIPHHGSKNGLTQSLLDAVSPDIAVISVGENNSYGHPHQEIIKMLNNNGINYHRTDLEGDIVVKLTDEGRWYIK